MKTMKYLIIFLGLISLNSCSQSIDQKDLIIKGDWYYFSGEENIYTEIFFKDTTMQWITRFSDIPPLIYKIEKDSIYLEIFNCGLFEQELIAKLEIKEINNISLIRDTITIDLFRIASSEYSYSKYMNDYVSLESTARNQRDSVFQLISTKQDIGLRKREIFARLNHRLINKNEVMQYLDNCIKTETKNPKNLMFCIEMKKEIEKHY